MEELMNRLAISKKIMDKHNEIPRNGTESNTQMSSPQVQSFAPIPATYNIPESYEPQQVATQQMGPPTQDRILNSKLPEEIKKLMMEHPIEKPSIPGTTTSVLSEDVIKGAQKLMGTNYKPQEQPKGQNIPGLDMNMFKTMIRDIVRDTVRDVVREELQKSGMITESENKTNDSLQIKVGKHIFEGKVTKIKKVE